MKIILTLLVRDEVDVIASFVAHHLAQGVDHIMVTDNGSRDGTYEVLQELARATPMTLHHEPPADFSQHRWVTRMARAAAAAGADWVINADADEFFVYRGGTLREALTRVKRRVDVLYARRHDFVPYQDSPALPVPQAMPFRKRLSMNLRGDPLPPKAIHRADSQVVITQGNHEARGPSLRGPPVVGAIEVFHYPIRSYRQFESKVRNGGSGYARNSELHPEDGFHKRYWYDLLLAGRLEEEYRERRWLTRERLVAGLRDGTLVEDRTLANGCFGR
jgi:hypothetical protein